MMQFIIRSIIPQVTIMENAKIHHGQAQNQLHILTCGRWIICALRLWVLPRRLSSTHILSVLNPAMLLTKTGLILIISANEAGRIMKAKRCDSPQAFLRALSSSAWWRKGSYSSVTQMSWWAKQGNLMKLGGNSQAELTGLTKCFQANNK